MKRTAIIAALFTLFAVPGFSQSASIAPLEIPAGAVVSFQLQSRLNPSASDPADALPAGTPMRVKLLDAIDSHVDQDGSSFRGVLVSPLEQNNHVILDANAQVHGLFALLRSRQHPEGFRYELLVTNVVDGGKSYVVTASLDHSLFEPTVKRTSAAQPSASITVGAN
ncbi:MAG TPA: hypothetical protein VMB47_15055 [Candidatus Aquilonibacter sp.]|nr:hypothetical protein [Candidatus Aquilonibacter sp.]